MGLMIKVTDLPGGEQVPKLELDDAATAIGDFNGTEGITEVEVPGAITLPAAYMVLSGKNRLVASVDYTVAGNTFTFPNGISRRGRLSIVDLSDGSSVWVWHPVTGQIFPEV